MVPLVQIKSIENGMQKLKNTSGFTIIEIIIASAIISITVFTLMSSAQKGIALSGRALRQVQANVLLEEGAEAVKSIRDNNWATIGDLTLETNYYLFFDTTNNIWSLSGSSITPSGSIPIYPIDSIFTRTVVISNVNRDGNDDIADIGTLDDRTKKITIGVSWPEPGETVTKNLVFYLADIFN